MLINGVEVREIKDVQDVLVALEMLRSQFSILSEELDEKIIKYSSLHQNFDNDIEKIKEFFSAINDIQIHLNYNIENIEKLNSKNIENSKIFTDMQRATARVIKENFQHIETLNKSYVTEAKKLKRDMLNDISSKFDILKSEIKEATNDVDLSNLRDELKSLIETTKKDISSDITKIKNATKKLNDEAIILENTTSEVKRNIEKNNKDIANELKDINTNYKNALYETNETIEESLTSFNKAVKSINYIAIAWSFLAGLLISTFLLFAYQKNRIDYMYDAVFDALPVTDKNYIDKYNNLNDSYNKVNSKLQELQKKYQDLQIKYSAKTNSIE